MKEYSASEITKRAIEILTLRGCTVWRNNNVRAVRGRTFTGRKGVSDIIGWSRPGLFLACEIKKTGDTLKKDQIEFLNDVVRCNGHALIAKQVGNEIVIENYKP